jgi:hypothetical protein
MVWSVARLCNEDQLRVHPKAIVRVNYRPILSSKRVPHIKKPSIVRQKTKLWSWAPDGSPTDLPTDC